MPVSTPDSEVEVGEISLASWATGAASSLLRAVIVREGGTLRGSRSSSGIKKICLEVTLLRFNMNDKYVVFYLKIRY